MHLEDVRRQKRALAIPLTPCEVDDSSHRTPPVRHACSPGLRRAQVAGCAREALPHRIAARRAKRSRRTRSPRITQLLRWEGRPFVLTPDAYPQGCRSYPRGPAFIGIPAISCAQSTDLPALCSRQHGCNRQVLPQPLRHAECLAYGPPDVLGVLAICQRLIDGPAAEPRQDKILGHALGVAIAELLPHPLPELRQPHPRQRKRDPTPTQLKGRVFLGSICGGAQAAQVTCRGCQSP
jgi:hypothetical protein